MVRSRSALASIAIVFSCAVLPVAAQVFRAKSELVVLQVAVHNKKEEPVADLTQADFRVFEDGVPQEVKFFVSWDQPVAIGLVVDNSASMIPKRREVIAAAEEFVRGSNPEDAVFILNFNDRVSFALPPSIPFSSDTNVLRRALATIGASGQTALYDAVGVGLDHVQTSTLDQRVLVVISDGSDNRSRRQYKDVLDRAMASNAVIYTVGIFDPIEGGNKKALRQLAETTGGMSFFPERLEEIREVLDRICLDVRHRYTLGYVSNSTRSGFRKIKVTATDAEHRRQLEVRARTGYLASSNGTSE